MRWEQGRAAPEQMIGARELQRVPASREHADRLLAESQRHLASARDIRDSNPEGAYQLLYDGVRKALTAVLADEGLRPTTSCGHRAVYSAAAVQLDPPMGVVLRPFDRMRRQRHEIEYSAMNQPSTSPAIRANVVERRTNQQRPGRGRAVTPPERSATRVRRRPSRSRSHRRAASATAALSVAPLRNRAARITGAAKGVVNVASVSSGSGPGR